MARELVVTASGPDRPGIVAELTGHITAAGANIADSRMVSVRGRYAIVVIVEGASDVLDDVQRRLRSGAELLQAQLEFHRPLETVAAGVPFRMKTYSMDQPGIVHRFTSHLRQAGVHVSQVETRLESAPFMGTPVFTMDVRMEVPSTTSVKDLRRALTELADELNCDVDLERA